MTTPQKILLAVTGLFISSFVTEGEAYTSNNKRKGAPLYDPAKMNQKSPQQLHEEQEQARKSQSGMDASDKWNRARGL